MKKKLSKDFDISSEQTIRHEPTFSMPAPISMFETFKSTLTISELTLVKGPEQATNIDVPVPSSSKPPKSLHHTTLDQ